VTRSFAQENSPLFPALLAMVSTARVTLAALQAVLKSLKRIVQRIPTRAFWRGEGYLFDRAHGGLETHLAIPRKVADEANRFGFRLLKVLGDDYPSTSHSSITDWYYYVFSKSQSSGEK
jgi:hypothetical protein